MATLLQIVQEVARRHGLSTPPGVVTSNNETIQQLWGLANETVEELNARYKWPELVVPLTFEHENGSDYRALTIRGPSAAMNDWRNLQPGTLVDSGDLMVAGPVDDVTWRNFAGPNPRYGYRLFAGSLHIRPVPDDPVTETFSLEYYSTFIVEDENGVGQESFETDTDICKIPSRLVVQGLRWRYKKEKGLPYAEDKDLYEMEVVDYTSNTGQQRPVKMDQDERCGEAGPMILVPSGNWPLP